MSYKRLNLLIIITQGLCWNALAARPHQPTYFGEVSKIIQEIRPKPNLELVKQFVAEVPTISSKKNLHEKAAQLSDYLFKKWNIQADNSYQSREQQDNILPDSVLKVRRGHCVGLTTLFLLAAEKAGVKAFLVRGPDHVFPRICDGNQCINIETLQKGKVVEDSYYLTNLSVPKAALERKIYLKSLTSPQELSASIYLGLGFVSASAGQTDLAELFYSKVVELSPQFAEGYSNLASILAGKGEIRQALSLLQKAYEINPTHYATLANLGVLAQKEHRINDALKYYEQAIAANPLSTQVYRKRSTIYREQNNLKASLLDLERILIIQPKYCDVRADRLSLQEKLSLKTKDEELIRYKSQGQCLYLAN